MRVVEQKKAVNSQNNKTRKENNQVMEDRLWLLQVQWLRLIKTEIMKLSLIMKMKIWMNLERIHTDKVMLLIEQVIMK